MYIGIDIGTQSLKVVVTDDRLQVLGAGSRAYEHAAPAPGWAEQDPLVWEQALEPCVAEALAKAGVGAGSIRALGVSGQLDGCVAVDDGGAPVAPCLIWMDRRAGNLMPALPSDFQSRTGLVADPGHMAAKIAWFKSQGLGRRFHQPVSYLVERLTGESVFDHGLASTSMLFELGADGLSADLCASFGIEAHELPRIDRADAVAGQLSPEGARLTGLEPGLSVAVGTGDDFATPLGGGVTKPGALVCVLGTAEVVGAVSTSPVIDTGGLLETHGYFGGRYFLENPGWLSGGSIAWARSLLGFASDAELDAAAAEAPPGCDGLLFFPGLTGAMAPRWNADARGCFYGFTASHDRGHFARAVLEGCAYSMHDVQVRLTELGEDCQRLVALGGGAASDLWLQMRADLSGLPTLGASGTEHCAVGAAVLAVAACETEGIDEVVSRMTMELRSFQPDAGPRDAYLEAHHRYRRLFDELEPMFGE